MSSRQCISNVIRSYKRFYRPSLSKQLQFYNMQRSMSEVKEKAALAKLPSGKRHPHQRRISGEVLQTAKNSLLRLNLEDSKSFSELHAKVEKGIKRIPGIGDLAVYDTALRIGAYLGLEPELVYLHAGVRDGVKALGLNHKLHTLEKSKLPREFHVLKPHEIEDCLCIYKKELGGKRMKRKAGCGMVGWKRCVG